MVWEVMLIKAGLSKNRCPEGAPYYYGADMLRAAIPLFEGRPLCLFEMGGDMSHVDDQAAAVKFLYGFPKNVIGRATNVRWGRDAEGNEGLICTAKIVDREFASRMLEAWNAGERDLFEWSIDGDGPYEVRRVAGLSFPVADVTIKLIDSIDSVTAAAAGGKTLRMVAALYTPEGKMKKLNPKVLFKLCRVLEARKATQDRLHRILEAEGEAQASAAIEEMKKEAVTLPADQQKMIEQAIEAISAGNADEALAVLQKLYDAACTPPAQAAAQPTPAAPPAQASQEPARPAADASAANGGSQVKPEDVAALREDVKRLREERDREAALNAIATSNLPEITKNHLREDVKGGRLTSQRVSEAITHEQKYLENLGVGMVGGVSRISESGRSDAELALRGFFRNEDLLDDKKRPVRRFMHLKEAAARGFGHRGEDVNNAQFMLGLLAGNYSSTLRRTEAMLSTTFDAVFADAMHKELLREYQLPENNDWQKIAERVSVPDFRDYTFSRIGYWGEPSTVDADGGTYTEFADLSDEGVAVSVSTKGNLFSVTRKMIVNDDMRAIQKLPQRAGRAMKMRIYRAVFGVGAPAASTSGIFLTGSGAGVTCYDGVTLIHASAWPTGHANGATSGGTALSGASMNTCRAAMMKQTAYGSDSTSPEALGEANLPKWLVIPVELETMAQSLCKSVNMIQLASAAGGYAAGQILPDNPALNIHSQVGMDYILVPGWTDTDNWYAVSDPNKVPGLCVAFLRGQEEPELTQEAANTGSNFTAKKVTYCISQDVGVKVVDPRAFYGQVV